MNNNLQGLRTLTIIVAVALLAVSYFTYSMHEEPKLLRLDTPQANSTPADEGIYFDAPGLDGKDINLTNYRGHPVILDFWATWCGPCRKQIPELVALYKKYNKSRGLVIIGVSCDMIQGDGVKAVAPFVQEFQINYPIAIADERLVDNMGVEAIPTTFFLSADGKLFSRIVGAGKPGEITESTNRLLDNVKGGAKPADNSGHVESISVVN